MALRLPLALLALVFLARPAQPCAQALAAKARAKDELFNPLLVRIAQGDREAFETLTKEARAPLRLILKKFLYDETMVEDTLQEVWLRIWLKAGSFESDRSGINWMAAIASHKAIDALRRGRVRRHVSLNDVGRAELEGQMEELGQLLVQEAPTPAEEVEVKERVEQLRKGLGQLESRVRSVVVGYYLENLKYKEVAQRLSIPLGTVKSRMRQAKLALKAQLKD